MQPAFDRRAAPGQSAGRQVLRVAVTDDSMPRSPVDPRAGFDELGRLVLAEHSMESLLQRVAELAKTVVPGASEVSVTLIANERPSTVACTGQLAMDLDETQYEEGFGPCLAAASKGEVMHIDDMATETRWPAFTAAALKHGAHGSLSAPIPLPQVTTAALNIYADKAAAFDEQSKELAVTFASYAGVALANMHLYDSTRQLAQNLETAMQSRAIIDQAKGVLMAQRRRTPEQAFDLLVSASQRTNRKLRDVAQSLVDSAGRPVGRAAGPGVTP